MTSEDQPRLWRSRGEVSVLGTGKALPGLAIGTDSLADLAGLDPRQRALATTVADRLGIRTRHIGRAWRSRTDRLADGCSNPELAAAAVTNALHDAGLQADDLGYLIGHTATPAQPLPANVALVADRPRLWRTSH